MENKKFIGSCKNIGDWGIGFGVKKIDLEALMAETQGEWVNIVIAKKSQKSGNPYAYVDTFKPKPKSEAEQPELPTKSQEDPF